MPSVMSRVGYNTYNRYVIHGNIMNKRNLSQNIEKSNVKHKDPMNTKKRHGGATHSAQRNFNDMVSQQHSRNTAATADPSRFSLPTSLNNMNFYEHTDVKAHQQMKRVLKELKLKSPRSLQRERRYTLPNNTLNANIYDEIDLHAHQNMKDVLSELKQVKQPVPPIEFKKVGNIEKFYNYLTGKH